MPPPISFTDGPTPISCTARTMPTESFGYDITYTMSGLAARIARTIEEKSTVVGG